MSDDKIRLIKKYFKLKTPTKESHHCSFFDNKGIKLVQNKALSYRVEEYLSVKLEYDTTFNQHEFFTLNTFNNHYAIYRHVPAGYSEYTYELEESVVYYPEFSFETFIKTVLTPEEIDATVNTIKNSGDK